MTPQNEHCADARVPVDPFVSAIPPELAAMLEAAWCDGYVAGCGYVPDDGLEEEARKSVPYLLVLGEIGGVKLRRIRVLKR
jgi:hypothetical protein